MAAIRYFFSYARADAKFVLRLAQELRSVGANVWVDQLDIMAGQRWDHAVEEALKTCQGMIIVLSPHSVASVNVMDEVSYALGKAKPIVPILLRPCEIPFRLQRLQQVDFTGDYDAGFTRLLRDLKIERPAPAEVPQPRRDRQATQMLAESGIARDNAQKASTASQGGDFSDSAKQSFIVTHPRLIGAFIGAIIGGVWAVSWSLPIVFIAIDGIVGAITGTTIGRDWRVLAVTIVAIVIGFTLWAIISSIPDAAIVGAPLGAIVGSFVGSFLKEQRGWP